MTAIVRSSRPRFWTQALVTATICAALGTALRPDSFVFYTTMVAACIGTRCGVLLAAALGPRVAAFPSWALAAGVTGLLAAALQLHLLLLGLASPLWTLACLLVGLAGIGALGGWFYEIKRQLRRGPGARGALRPRISRQSPAASCVDASQRPHVDAG